MPKTKLGRWSGILMAVFLAFLSAIILGRRIILPGTPIAFIVGIGAMITGIGTFVCGLASLMKFRDRSFIVVLATFFGSVAILIIIMEVVERIIWLSNH